MFITSVSINEVMKDPKIRLDPSYWCAMKSNDPFEYEVSLTFADTNAVRSMSFVFTSTFLDCHDLVCAHIFTYSKALELKGAINVHIKVKKNDYVFKEERCAYLIKEDGVYKIVK